MQVGPLAQVLIGYAQGHPLTKKWTDAALRTISSVAGRPVTIGCKPTMGRQAPLGRIVQRRLRTKPKGSGVVGAAMAAVLAHLTRLNVTYRLKINQQSPESASRKADLLN